MKYFYMNFLFICFMLSGCNAEAQLQMPKDLYEIAKEENCVFVENFYNRPGMIDPPYIYGYKPGLKEDSVAFWCENKNSAKPYQLVLAHKRQVEMTIGWSNYPGGLSFSEKRDFNLSNFRHIDDTKKRGPEKIIEDSLLQSEYDGVVTYLYEYKGKWLHMILH